MASDLARGEDDQKKLVANVSHDFRSPLTSIKGYSEAMLDGTIPPELYEKYRKDFIIKEDEYEKWDLAHLVVRPSNISVRKYYWYRTIKWFYWYCSY